MEQDNRSDEIQKLIEKGSYDEAEKMLTEMQMPSDMARWNYLMAVLSMYKGWLENCSDYAKTAAELDPQNKEYTEYYEKVKAVRSAEELQRSYGSSGSGDCGIDGGDCCQCCLHICESFT